MTMNAQSRAERAKFGKSLRKATPRAALSKFTLTPERDANAILNAQSERRLPALRALRIELMIENPFAYLRGAAAVMAHDLASQPIVGASVQACGDCHLMNFGAFATPENNILFDINDFDETLPGVDFTVDVKRLAASVAVAAPAGASKADQRTLAAASVRAYRRHMFDLSQLSPFEIWHSHIDLEIEADRFENETPRKKILGVIARARGEGLDRDDNFPTLAAQSDPPRIRDKEPRIFHFAEGSDAANGFDTQSGFDAYRLGLGVERRALYDRYALKDFVFKAVGVGSVGTYCYVGLFLSGDRQPLFLQVKEATNSVLEALSPDLAYGGHQGQRVAEGQRMLQAASDIFLGWTQHEASGRQYYVRILKNRRLGQISELGEAEDLADYAMLCGKTLARAHARSGDPAVIAGYIGKSNAFEDAIADFALAYADQTLIDHTALVNAHPPQEKAANQNEKSKGAADKGAARKAVKAKKPAPAKK